MEDNGRWPPRTCDAYMLRWRRHESNAVEMMAQFYQTGEFSDVLLSVGGMRFKSHKIVLASCSVYFNQLFRSQEAFRDLRHGDSPNIVVMKDEPHVMKALLDFMYTGEAKVRAEDLSQLLECAKELGVKGLVVETESKTWMDFGNTPTEILESSPSIAIDLSDVVRSERVSPTVDPNETDTGVGKGVRRERKNKNIDAIANRLLMQVQSEENDSLSPPCKTDRDDNGSDLSSLNKTCSSLFGRFGSSPAISIAGSSEEWPNSLSPSSVRNFANYCTSELDTQENHSGWDLEDSYHDKPESPASNGKRSTKRYKQYEEADMIAAIREVESNNMSPLRAARVHKVPSRTLYDRVNRKRKGGNGRGKRTTDVKILKVSPK